MTQCIDKCWSPNVNNYLVLYWSFFGAKTVQYNMEVPPYHIGDHRKSFVIHHCCEFHDAQVGKLPFSIS